MAKDKVKKVLEDEVDEEIDEVEEDTVEVLSAKAVATMLGTDGRTFRKFLRSQRGKVGQGNRWAIGIDEVEELRKGFEAFNKPKPSVEKVIKADVIDADDFDELLEDEALEIDDLEEIEI